MNKDRPALSKKGLARSSPSLAASFSLRQYSENRKRIPSENKSNTASVPELILEEIDRLGGNGRWRQRKAEEDFKQKQIEELERQRHQRILEEARRKRKMELEAKRRRQMQEEEAQRRAELEKEKREQEEREEARRQKEEAERRRRAEEEADWLARQPKTCETCSGSGLCHKCEGKGHLFAMFLVPQVKMAGAQGKDFGRSVQGCDQCGGYRQNLMGELRKGTGRCAACDGVGKITPKIDPRSTRPRFSSVHGDQSPKLLRRGSRDWGDEQSRFADATPTAS